MSRIALTEKQIEDLGEMNNKEFSQKHGIPVGTVSHLRTTFDIPNPKPRNGRTPFPITKQVLRDLKRLTRQEFADKYYCSVDFVSVLRKRHKLRYSCTKAEKERLSKENITSYHYDDDYYD